MASRNNSLITYLLIAFILLVLFTSNGALPIPDPAVLPW